MNAPSLFDLLPVVEQCRTCKASRPDDYARALWLEPVSGECPSCERATLGEIFGRWPSQAVTAIQRHLGKAVTQ